MSDKKPVRLYLEPDRLRSDGRLRTASVWVIRDGSKKSSTGCGPGDHAGAQRALEAYLAKQHAGKALPKRMAASEVLVADVMVHYMRVKAETVVRPDLLAIRVRSLLGFWGDKTLDDIDSASCRAYVAHRAPHVGGARRELEDLRSAIGQAKADKLCREEVKVTVSKKPGPRKHYLERDAVARLVWHAYRKRERQVVHRGPRKGQTIETSTRHLARFILVALYTGTRAKRVWSASFERRDGHPWLDVDKGVYYREAPEETASATKRAPAVRIPPRLLAHLRRWKSGGHDPKAATTFLCEYRKGRCGDTKKAFARLVDEVLAEEGDEIVRHSLRHTAATWLLQADEDVHAVAGYLGMNTNTLIRTYAHHNAAFQASIGDAFTTGRAGRIMKSG